MKRHSTLLVALLALLFALTGCRAQRVMERDWTNDVAEYLDQRFENAGSFTITPAGYRNNAHIYAVTIPDAPHLGFSVVCEQVYARDFFAYTEQDSITDTFGESVTEYVSDLYGVCCVTGKTLSDVEKYVESTVRRADELYGTYHKRPCSPVSVRFLFFNATNAVLWAGYSPDAQSLRETLRETFGESLPDAQRLSVDKPAALCYHIYG